MEIVHVPPIFKNLIKIQGCVFMAHEDKMPEVLKMGQPWCVASKQ